jgi:hypothetical protein
MSAARDARRGNRAQRGECAMKLTPISIDARHIGERATSGALLMTWRRLTSVPRGMTGAQRRSSYARAVRKPSFASF